MRDSNGKLLNIGDRVDLTGPDGKFYAAGVVSPTGVIEYDTKATRERLEAMVEEEAKRKAAIPAKLLELATEAGVMVGVIGVDHIETEHERLVALWNAIVKADASL